VIKLGEVVMVLDLHRQGLTVSAIARELGVDRKTVRRRICEPQSWRPVPQGRVALSRGRASTRDRQGEWRKQPKSLLWRISRRPLGGGRGSRRSGRPLATRWACCTHRTCRSLNARITTGRKKRINGPPPQPTLPTVRHAILELIARRSRARDHEWNPRSYRRRPQASEGYVAGDSAVLPS